MGVSLLVYIFYNLHSMQVELEKVRGELANSEIELKRLHQEKVEKRLASPIKVILYFTRLTFLENVS